MRFRRNRPTAPEKEELNSTGDREGCVLNTPRQRERQWGKVCDGNHRVNAGLKKDSLEQLIDQESL